ncbi:MAG TPA: histidine triad nucleotide-binding protein [Actinomycetota bacterium]|nr:histidine triad nucleotide-binding protein [Actinomycetota bacterium]
MSDCLFCRIVAGEIPADVVWESEHALAFRDINPQAPTHVQVIPRKHVPRIADFDAQADREWLSDLFEGATQVARQEGLGEGFRLVINNGAMAGQSVMHVHLHVLGGRPLGWPPG